MKRSQRWSTLQICTHRGSNSGGSDLWSKALPVRPRRRPIVYFRCVILLEQRLYYLSFRFMSIPFNLLWGYDHWPKRKLDRAIRGVWMGRHDQTAPTSGRWKSNVEAAALRVLNLRIQTFSVMCAYNFVCADNLYYSSPIICHEICICRFIQVRRSSLIGIKRQR